MKRLTARKALPEVREYRVAVPGATYQRTATFEREDFALGYAADLAVLYCGDSKEPGKPVTVSYPNGAVIELTAKQVRGPQ